MQRLSAGSLLVAPRAWVSKGTLGRAVRLLRSEAPGRGYSLDRIDCWFFTFVVENAPATYSTMANRTVAGEPRTGLIHQLISQASSSSSLSNAGVMLILPTAQLSIRFIFRICLDLFILREVETSLQKPCQKHPLSQRG